MPFTQVQLLHHFDVTAGVLIGALSENMTNGTETVSAAPTAVTIGPDGSLFSTWNATDDPGTVTLSGNPPLYTFYLQLPGVAQQVLVSAIPSGAPLGVLDWSQLPLANGSVPSAAPQSQLFVTGVPSSAQAANGVWAFSSNGHIYFCSNGAWAQVI